jgi:ribose 5-phosphate isomerase B
MKMKIGIGADHRGYKLKQHISSYLKARHHNVFDFGTNSTRPADYPVIALKIARQVAKGKLGLGIVSCYSGQGMAIAANKVRGIRAAICTDRELARLARAHNDANILVLPAGNPGAAKKWRSIINSFLATSFDGGRHQRRLNIIRRYEKRRKV